ncbi:hypothetical protein BO221_03840 [Archangium sp. Cb G35]|uniref:hypothetical protein n=1 Tax=Archangium sp. Cb G35 TaxID=1920190 RepID=UPI000935D506|nr:hypothetical protein [Archangium sp. Cb G35]OJT27134.1 hypothetical protein BO221_03840 [Archangium sp. Cb G35]
MTRWMKAVAVVALGAVGCTQEQKPAAARRAELKMVSGSTMEIIPAAGQYPYCMLFTVSEKGIIRQLTMTRENRSIKCDAGKRIYNSSFRVPVEEGKVKAYVFFSDQRIQAGSVAQQLYDLRDKPQLTAMDFRLPGSVSVETLEFTPQPGGEPVTGAVVGTTDIETNAEGSQTEEAEVEEPGQDMAPPKVTPPPNGGGSGLTATDAVK